MMVYFLTNPKLEILFEHVQTLGVDEMDSYEILEIQPVCGRGRVRIEPTWHMVRVETATPAPSTMEVTFKGGVRHLQYTSGPLRSELQKKSIGSYPSSKSTLAVLIPIGKSETWWNLPQDERQRHFEKTRGVRNHTAIGTDYAGRIYRKLYHSRYLETSPVLNYDFLTYFEFNEKDKSLFKSLLHELRDSEINPEWQFVNLELEIWMIKKESRLLK